MVKKLIGAYITGQYYAEVFDKFKREHADVPMTHLFRALVGKWFDGNIQITQEDLDQYKADGRKFNFGQVGFKNFPGVQADGYKAANQSIPLLANPFQPDTIAHDEWEVGWKKYFTKKDDTNGQKDHESGLGIEA